MEPNDLVSLKVPELKARCKQLGISNYSKLPKLQLIEMLTTHASSSTCKPSIQGDHLRCGPSSEHHGNLSGTSVHLTPGQHTLPQSTDFRPEPDASYKVTHDDAAACHSTVEGSHVEQSRSEQESTPVSQTAADQLTSAKGATTVAVKRHTIDRLARSSTKAPPTACFQSGLKKGSKARNSAPIGEDVEDQRLSVIQYGNALMHPQLDTTASRVQYAKEHLLNRLLQNLNASRTHPIIAPPFPRPLPFDTRPHDPTFGLAFQGIHPDLYENLQNSAFLICFRFWTWRLYISFQLGSGEAWSSDAREMGLLGPDISGWPAVIQCRHIRQDLWLIETQSSSRGLEAGLGNHAMVWEAFMVLGETGEVISRTPKSTRRSESPIQDCNIRSDWHHFIEENGVDPMPFVIKTKDECSFPEGVSRHWRAKAGGDQQLIRIACRAALASCAVSSFSGIKLSAVQMDAEWLGRPLDQREIQGKNKVELYLPEALQILSVHLPDPPFHPALAIVQRSMGHADIVLIETGQVVGNEDLGITSLWQGILACNEKGGTWPVNEMSDFWQGWESRILDGEL
ncbi:hypothetical protein BCR39DRAFT_556270 [Naematelia encephala]|uniref:Rho termination factor-like N-terminal domain-containing protein n=1 Tax=Naematelia encephala TaxID=71784 RepID=A0A1Y2BJ07_9TREE|nr:hypothetical protein BCR39DRAFT_556270 [Naematelia encephala]